MVQFYFNSTYPKIQSNVKLMFSNVVKQYMHLYQQRTSLMDDYVITCKAPSLMEIGELNLAKIIVTIEDRNVRYFAISAFSKYPIDHYINPDIWDEEGAEWDYVLNGLSVEEMYFAHRMDWLLLSLPITDDYKHDSLCITHRKDETKVLNITNFYGDNELAILQVIDQREQYTKTPLATLVEDILAGCECKMTEEFVKEYEDLPHSAQTSVNEVFRIMHERGCIFPAIKADIKHIKRCVDMDGLFELRVLSEVGPRVYMRVDDGVLYLGYLGTKAESVGVEQTADMRRAQLYIDQIK